MRSGPTVTYTKAQRERSKLSGQRLVAVFTPTLSFGGCCTKDEVDELTAFAEAFILKRSARLKADREQQQAEYILEAGN